MISLTIGIEAIMDRSRGPRDAHPRVCGGLQAAEVVHFDSLREHDVGG